MKRSYPAAYYYLRLLAIVLAALLVGSLYTFYMGLFIPTVAGQEIATVPWAWVGLHLYTLVVLTFSFLSAQLFQIDKVIKHFRLRFCAKWRLSAMVLAGLFLLINILPHLEAPFFWLNPFGIPPFNNPFWWVEINSFTFFFLPLPFLWGHILVWDKCLSTAVANHSI